MKLLSIKKTNKLVPVKFAELAIDHRRTQTEKAVRPNRVLTPSGWSDVLDFAKIKTGKSVKLIYGNNSLVCDPKHRVQTKHGWEYVENLIPGVTSIQTISGYTNDYVIESGGITDLYDIEIAYPHAYYTSGVVSHNSVMLCNNAKACHANGENVLYVTFELSTVKTAMRIVGSMTGVEMRNIRAEHDKVRDELNLTNQAHTNDIAIYELPPGECSVNNIYAIMDNLKRQQGWKPTVVILDYLELMVSRHSHNNRDGDYTTQKHVATEIRGLARNENVLVLTATQGNRGSTDQKDEGEYINLSKMAESYGKAMPLDYVISINQTDAERNKHPAECRFYIAKNRNGEKFKSITACVNYRTMRAMERP